ncbi:MULTISPECIES: hypothetical protein [Cupriavidus]|jgi:hypothetical protein|uniref:Uncharacterized protein n=1 Tax=Cupriavidus metallidurans TaxID=119219 RepID=A0A2L0X3Q6_9BURK|nr:MULTISPECIES: hypothetical protein [Cupriavidus]AVA34748.1 hypothetical protein C3Z06_14800 [Cupriavidus metallidurans]KWR85031.1 hypothetical protein RN01_05495 [Cupriavidus sp. SHE]QBP12208.1 hypothetical protein DDF84_020770 [Cupriavidus metallidurans]QWC92176.1 hypothetical protein KB891_20825 [Cupriavidus metallidurans]
MSVELVAFDAAVDPASLARFLGRKCLPAGTSVAIRYSDAGSCSPVLRQWFREMSTVFTPSRNTGDPKCSLHGHYAFASDVAGVTVPDDVQQLAEHHASRVADQLQLGLMSISDKEPRIWLPALR